MINLRGSLDFEHLFDNYRIEDKLMKTLLMLYQERIKNLLLSFFFFLINYSPIWVIPTEANYQVNSAKGLLLLVR